MHLITQFLMQKARRVLSIFFLKKKLSIEKNYNPFQAMPGMNLKDPS